MAVPGTAPDAGTAQDMLKHRPSAALAPFVSSITGYCMDGIDIVHHGLPSTELTFILALGAPITVGWSADRSRSGEFQAMVSGLHTSPAFVFPTPHHSGIQLGLTPAGARAMFGLPASELHAELVDLQQMWAALGSRLVERLAGCLTWPERFGTLDRELCQMVVPDAPEIRPELRWAWHQLVRRGATEAVQLAAEIGWSRGYFARLFADEFGLKPKETARIVRFGKAKKLVGQPTASLADVALQSGYADQAHLTREWRRLAGCTPTEWQSEMLSFVQDNRRAPEQG
jgi:AraC-like DNA-binding protein